MKNDVYLNIYKLQLFNWNAGLFEYIHNKV